MRNTMLVFVILCLVASVNCACDSSAALTCLTTRDSEKEAAGTDQAKICSAHRTFISCMSNAGCSSSSLYTPEITAANNVINTSCGGSMVTASVLTMILTLFAMLFK